MILQSMYIHQRVWCPFDGQPQHWPCDTNNVEKTESFQVLARQLMVCHIHQMLSPSQPAVMSAIAINGSYPSSAAALTPAKAKSASPEVGESARRGCFTPALPGPTALHCIMNPSACLDHRPESKTRHVLKPLNVQAEALGVSISTCMKTHSDTLYQ